MGAPSEDPLSLFGRILTKSKTMWMRWTYPFAGFGQGNSIHYSCDLKRSISERVKIGNNVYIAEGTWLNIPEYLAGAPAALVIGNECRIGRRCMFSAKNLVTLEDNVLFGPSVLVTDHSHEFSDVNMPIHAQGLTAGGTVRIEQNCWLGHGAAIVGGSGELVVGRNSVVGANAVITKSVPPYSVVVGSPARILKRYDPEARKWVKQSGV